MGLAAFLLAQLTYTVLLLKLKQPSKYFIAWFAFIVLYIVCMASVVLPSVIERGVVLAVIIAAYMCAISAGNMRRLANHTQCLHERRWRLYIFGKR